MKIPSRLAAHPFVVLAVLGVLVGGGLRYVPTSVASGSTAPAGSTACAAT